MGFFKKVKDSIEIEVYPKENESVDSLIRRFRKKVNNSGILKDARKKEFFEKPSTIRRRKKSESTIRCRIETSKKEKLQDNER
jgi:small subunit ribosomal protein S21